MPDTNDVSTQIVELKNKVSSLLGAGTLDKNQAIGLAAAAGALEKIVKPAGILDTMEEGDIQVARVVSQGDSQFARIGAIFDWQTISSNTVISQFGRYLVDTSAGPVTLTIHADFDTQNSSFIIKDAAGTFGTNSCFIDPPAGTDFEGASGAFEFNVEWRV
jgi:hypothetical protein